MSASSFNRYNHFSELDEPLDTQEGVLSPATRRARSRENLGINGEEGQLNGPFVTPIVSTLTATGAFNATANVFTLNHTTDAIAATLAAQKNKTVVVSNISASGTAAHTVTLASGTWDGTNDVATLNAPGEQIVVVFDEDGNGTVVMNIGGVAFSST